MSKDKKGGRDPGWNRAQRSYREGEELCSIFNGAGATGGAACRGAGSGDASISATALCGLAGIFTCRGAGVGGAFAGISRFAGSVGRFAGSFATTRAFTGVLAGRFAAIGAFAGVFARGGAGGISAFAAVCGFAGIGGARTCFSGAVAVVDALAGISRALAGVTAATGLGIGGRDGQQSRAQGEGQEEEGQQNKGFLSHECFPFC